MAGYDDTKRLIIETLMGRPSGTEIQPEKHQEYALSMLEYIRNIELISGSSLIGVANENTVPVQPDNSRVSYIAGIAQNRTMNFQNFIGQNGEALSVTTGDMECYLIILLWNTEYWSMQVIPSNIISQAENATFYYRYNIRKTYNSVTSMNADSENPIGTDGKPISVGDIVSVVNTMDDSENAIYSRTKEGWQFQAGMNFALVQETGNNPNVAMSQKATTENFIILSDGINKIYGGKLLIERTYLKNNENIKGYIKTDGSLQSDNTWNHTDYITIPEGCKTVGVLLKFTPVVACVAYYNLEKTFIGYNTESDNGTKADFKVYNIPAEAKYVIVSYWIQLSSITQYFSFEGDILDDTLLNPQKLDEYLEPLYKEIDAVKEGYKYIDRTNDININGYYSTGGAFVSDSGWKRSDYIPIDEDATFKYGIVGHNGVRSIAFFDSEKTYISSVVLKGNGNAGDYKEGVIYANEKPSNAKFVIVSIRNPSNVELEKGQYFSIFEKEIKDDAILYEDMSYIPHTWDISKDVQLLTKASSGFTNNNGVHVNNGSKISINNVPISVQKIVLDLDVNATSHFLISLQNKTTPERGVEIDFSNNIVKDLSDSSKTAVIPEDFYLTGIKIAIDCDNEKQSFRMINKQADEVVLDLKENNWIQFRGLYFHSKDDITKITGYKELIPLDIEVIFTGDSVTEGQGTAKQYHLFYRDYTGKKIAFLANGGSQINYVLSYMPYLINIKPKIITSMTGLNNGNSVNAFKQMQDYCDQQGIKYIVHHIPYGAGMYADRYEAQTQIIEEFITENAHIKESARFDYATAIKGDISNGYDSSLFVDQAHCNEEGHKHLFRRMIFDCPSML